MANNRMFLICNVCGPKPGEDWPSMFSEEFKAFFHVAKWYPGGDGAYYTSGSPEYAEKLNQYFIDHAHPEIPSESYKAGAGQPNPVRLDYESDDPPKVMIKGEL